MRRFLAIAAGLLVCGFGVGTGVGTSGTGVLTPAGWVTAAGSSDPTPALSFTTSAPDISGLSAALTINSITETPDWDYVGTGAGASTWTADGYGGTLAKVEDGADYTTGGATPVVTTAVAFDGASNAGDYYQLDESLTIGLQDIVIELVYRHATNAAHAVLVAQAEGGTTHGVSIRALSSDLPNLIFDDAADGSSFVSGGTAMVPGAWYHIFAVIDRSGNGQLCVNGVDDGEASFSAQSNTVASSDTAIGGDADATRVGKGSIAYARMWTATGWLDDEEQCDVALARFQAMTGVSVSGSSAVATVSTRASTAAVYDVNSVLHTVGNNWPRVEVANGGYLSEDDNENLFLQSQFASGWTELTAGDTTTPANATGPDGATSATTLASDGVGTAHGLTQAATLTAATWTVSVYAKKGLEDFLFIQDTTVAHSAYFDLTDCTVGATTVSVIDTFAENIDAGASPWCRVGFSFTGTAAAHTLQIQSAEANGDASFTGGVGTDTTIFGAQLELWAAPTSYIATAASAVERGDDHFSGTWSPAATLTWTIVTTQTVIDHDKATTTYLFDIYQDAADHAYIAMTGTESVSCTADTAGQTGSSATPSGTPDAADGTEQVVHCRSVEDDMVVWLGTTPDPSADTNYDPTIDAYTLFYVGEYKTNIGQLTGWINSVKWYDAAYDQGELP